MQKKTESMLKAMYKPCCFDSMVVISYSTNGSCHLVEVNGSFLHSLCTRCALTVLCLATHAVEDLEVTQFVLPEDFYGTSLYQRKVRRLTKNSQYLSVG